MAAKKLMEVDKAPIVLEGMEVTGWPGVYVLGCIDRRVTVYSQQVRALNLAAALMATERVTPGDPVVVVGAGASGLTCAAGLRRLAARVTVLEERDEILPLFRGRSTRWLHPGVYDWPLEGWSRDRAGLPLLDWMHGPVDDVRVEMEAGWSQIAEKDDIVRLGVSRVQLGAAGDTSRVVTWNPRGSQRVNTMILAVGFGLEPTPLSTEWRYWEGDDLDSVRVDGKVRKWLVSGCGDGALTELFRLCLDRFRHDQMLRDFTRDSRMRGLRDEIRRIEDDAALHDDPRRLHDAYLHLDAPWVALTMREQARRDTEVTLNAPTAQFLDRRASVLNRFLAGQLYQAGRFEFVQGKVQSAVPDGDEVVVRFEDGISDRFHRIVRRHGPESALAAKFPLIAQALESERIRRRNKPTLADQTRTRYWIDGIFGSEVRDVPDPEATAPKFKAVIVSADDVSPWRDQIEADLTRAGGAVELLRTGTYAERLDKIRAADVLVLVVAHRLGPVPAADEGGGDGKTPWLRLALDAARGIVVTARVDDQASWSEKKEQDELLSPGADVATIAGRVQALAALKEALLDPLVFGTQATIATPAELATAVVEQWSWRAQPTSTLSKGRRSWTLHVEHPLQPAPHFQGRAALLARLDQWWSDPASPDRVMALVAIGGVGKTALAERALRQIVASPSGGGAFVWSFYEAPSSGDFLREACRYFAGDPGQDVGGRLWALKTALRSGAPHLLVLDGLERVQAEGSPGRARGSLEDAPLRQLMKSLAAGLGRSRALVTSRFPLVDLESWKGGGLVEVRLDDLDPDSARALLQAWGVRGSDAVLDDLVARYGGHALSVSVLGSYIVNFGGGDPAAADHLDLSEAGRLDPKANKLVRLLTAYAEALPEEERQVMARLSIFPRGITVEALVDLVKDNAVAGVLRDWNQTRLAGALLRLMSRGLVFSYRPEVVQVFTAHPFVRDGFAGLLDVPVTAIHRVMAHRLAVGLDERPGTTPTDGIVLDQYEAIITHLLGAEQVQRAFDLYWRGLGGYRHLGKRLGDYVRIVRIVARFPGLGAPLGAPKNLSLHNRCVLLVEQGLSYIGLGDLAAASQAYEAAAHAQRKSLHEKSSYALSWNQSELQIKRGCLPGALAACQASLEFARSALSRGPEKDGAIRASLSHLVYVLALTGELNAARTHSAQAERLVRSDWFIEELYWSELCARVGDEIDVRALVESHLQVYTGGGHQRYVARCHALLGRLALPGDAPAARYHLALARDWATRTGDLEVILQVHQLAAALHHLTNDLDAALAELNEGGHIADDHGMGLYSIDLRIARARAHLDRNDPIAAQRDAREALDRSNDPECGYVWGEADAAHLLGEAYLARHDKINAERALERALQARARLERSDAAVTRERLETLRS